MSQTDISGLDSRPHAAETPSGTSPQLSSFARTFTQAPIAFEVLLANGQVRRFGEGPPRFQLRAKNRKGFRALTSLDEGQIADAYLYGDLDFDGDPLAPFELRTGMRDRHPLTAAWRFLQPILLGQERTNRSAIRSHYEIDADFFLSLLDPNIPCYTQGMFETGEESLEAATLRKFDYCFEKLGLKPGDRILEIGPGWGAWFEYASARGVKCTGISISRVSLDYLKCKSEAGSHDWKLVYSDLLAYEAAEKFDAIVIMGVIEHLPQYDRVLRKFLDLLKPGGKIFLDGSAFNRKYELCSFMVKHVYPGNHSFLVLHDFMAQMAKTPLRVLELFNDSRSYYFTFLHWARNFDRNSAKVIERFGEYNYRRFRLYLWGAVYQFLTRDLDCYRMIIHYPASPTCSSSI
jgi:cyclopropane-fatty-acyl-phospholipid synthase